MAGHHTSLGYGVDCLRGRFAASTLIARAPGPDGTTEMSKNDQPDVGARRPALTPGGGLRTGEHPAGPGVPAPPHRTGRRNQRSIVPTAAGLFCMVIGLSDFPLIVTAYLFLRPAEPKARLGERDAAKIRDLLARYGDRDSLGYFA